MEKSGKEQGKDGISVLVSLEASLLKAVDKCAHKLRYSREQFIQMACQQFIGQIDARELERIYREHLGQNPEGEELDLAEVGAILAGEVLPKEEW